MEASVCCVFIPRGQASDPSGRLIDFDAVFAELITPSLAARNIAPLRVDDDVTQGILRKETFERLIHADWAIIDLTATSAAMFYQLGIRHALCPSRTIMLCSDTGRLPFEAVRFGALTYAITDEGKPAGLASARRLLTDRLGPAAADRVDSPLYSLLETLPHPQRATAADLARFHADHAADEARRERIVAARSSDADPIDSLQAIERDLGDLAQVNFDVLLELYLAYRSAQAWDEMVELAERMPAQLAETVLVREQLALALNRAGDPKGAEVIIEQLLRERGPSSETYGVLGRLYKDQWEATLRSGETLLAQGLLDKAINAYLKGFEVDWRLPYTGINAVTLMEVRDKPDPRQARLLPVVMYAAERRLTVGHPDYWDYATVLEAAVLLKDRARAAEALVSAVTAITESWQPKTTARNLRLIREARQRRRDRRGARWALEIEQALERRG